MNGVFIIAMVVALSVFTLYMAISAYVSRKRVKTQMDDQLYHDVRLSAEQAFQHNAEKQNSRTKALEDFLHKLGLPVAAALLTQRKKLYAAGFDSPDAPVYLLFMQYIGRYIFLLGAALIYMSSNDATGIAISLFLVVFGFFGADLYLKNSSQKHEKKLIEAFPDTLDLLVVCVESGLALDAALARVCAELDAAHPEITKELNKLRLELALLNDRSQALMNFGERIHLTPYRSLVAALIQTEKFGTSLTDTLRVLSEDYRYIRVMRAEEKAGRLPVIMMIPLVLFLLPIMFIVILGPTFIVWVEDDVSKVLSGEK